MEGWTEDQRQGKASKLPNKVKILFIIWNWNWNLFVWKVIVGEEFGHYNWRHKVA